MVTDLRLWFFKTVKLPKKGGGPGRDRTADTWIFSPLLLPAELPAQAVNTRRKKKRL